MDVSHCLILLDYCVVFEFGRSGAARAKYFGQVEESIEAPSIYISRSADKTINSLPGAPLILPLRWRQKYKSLQGGVE